MKKAHLKYLSVCLIIRILMIGCLTSILLLSKAVTLSEIAGARDEKWYFQNTSSEFSFLHDLEC
jgi:hypothetical protein